MRTLRPWSLDALIKREQVFDGLIDKAVKMTLRPLVMNVGGLLTAAAAEFNISDLASSMLGPTVSMDSAGTIEVTWNNFVNVELMPFLADTMIEGAQEVYNGLGGDVPALSESLVIDYLEAAKSNLVNIGNFVWLAVRGQLADGVRAGEDMRELAQRVRNVSQVTAARAMMIARTEVHRAAEAGGLMQMKLAGFTDLECQKRWLATEDERTRLWHLQAEGQTVGLHQAFEVGGEYLQFPGDPNGRADNVINCRCTMEFLFAFDDEGDEDDDDYTLASGAPSQLRYTFAWTQEDEREHPRDNQGRFRKKNESGASNVGADLPPIPKFVEPAIPLRDILPLVTSETDNPPDLPFDNVRQLREIFRGEFKGGFSTKVTELDWARGNSRFRVQGKVLNKKGEEVGDFTRVFKIKSNGTFAVEHEYLLLDEAVQGQGFAQEFNKRAFEGYRRMGVQQVELQADIDVGGYAWARAGYDWLDDDVPSLAEMHDRVEDARMPVMTAPPPRTQKQIDDGHWPISHNLYKIPAERREEQAALAQQLWLNIGKTVSMDTEDDELPDIIEMWPTPAQLADLGRWEGAGKDDWWIGKAIMMGSNWMGVRYLDDLDGA